MDRFGGVAFTPFMTSTTEPTEPRRLDPGTVLPIIGRRSYGVLATSSGRGSAHAAGVLYALVDTDLYVSTERSSRKARNVAENPRVAVTIPIRRLPFGPPAGVQFQARAEVLDVGDPAVRELHAAGRLRRITSHGELELPDGCVLRVSPIGRLHTYGLGMSLVALLRDPLRAAGVAELPARI